ncbi:peptidase M24 [Clostridium thermosuccinogenes]|uniref:Peptidase M24 n=1 Tax=Clostridium thermosuccinogenes TaxID=84032 RepID=A0A2K2FN75_9CLOT|nr:aminopeptidase P family protein [Pseudoclostridium thermosuccinogenes]AUS97907.1 peptidase M24 [Pseudoclostridium thermosuccinogenes]PNU00204.1 peptidase M24 [Pseudoclostridium thermosuccinogenes]PNU01528.1 peptidase M24 [Pseudoclostridium thermosuccinogenes]
MEIKERVEKLRQLMKENGIDAYIIPSSDAHQSEYVADHWKSRQWISGFTGSAGTVVITEKDAGLWTDGRYYIQAEKQLAGSGIQLFRAGEPDVPSYEKWLKDVLKEGDCVGFDGSLFSVKSVDEMEKEFSEKKISLKTDKDLIGQLWTDRPGLPEGTVFVHDVKYAGKSRVEKLNEVRKEMKSLGANYYLLSSLDDIAWLLNIRGSDVPNNPVVISNAVISMDGCILFVDLKKIPSEIKKELNSDGVELMGYGDIQKFLEGIGDGDSIIIDPARTNMNLYNSINTNTKKIRHPNITTRLKAIKNDVEIQNLRNCMIKDGVAMVKFIKWLKESVGKEKITEISAEEKLEEFRRQQELFVEPSFDTIAGYKDHAAMMHYKATPESQYTLMNEGFLLVDSGGQYLDGTTDITRTIVLGKLTEEERRDFTLVLKGYLGLDSVKFLYGATGSNLDVLARKPIWEYGMDYKCGTGHGVGFFLNVHEGPQRISQVVNNVKLEKGMIVTNEPGIYKEGKHGIRTENIMLVVEDEKTESGQFMRFEALTCCPIDLDGIDVDLLTEAEKKRLNEYHKDVYSKLSPYLNEEEKDWLRKETREI